MVPDLWQTPSYTEEALWLAAHATKRWALVDSIARTVETDLETQTK